MEAPLSESFTAAVEYGLHLRKVRGDHTAPTHRFTIDEAHRTMQDHRSCNRHECVRKHAAWNVLVDAKRIVPDAGRQG